jgi:uncharacterized DUF497 family protein
MEFEWDEKKRRSNIIKHGLDFIDAAYLFTNQFLIMEDNRQDYGEKRLIAFGVIKNRHIVLSFTQRAGKIRIISMRKANKREQEKYQKKITDRLGKG